MPEKKQDILDEILGRADHARDHKEPLELSGLESLIYRSYKTEPMEEFELELPLEEPEVTSQPRRRTTHYLSEDVYAELGQIKDKISDLFASEHRHRVSRSDVVNQALRIVLEEFEVKGLESPLVGKIIGAVKKKAKQIKEEKHATERPVTRRRDNK
jgi:hypothetical protein